MAEGITTSFRYPHFMQQVHPTFPLPPPATIYGHIASVLGNWFDPAGVKFAYHFTYRAEIKDIEHIIVLSPSSGKLKGTNIPKVMEGRVNPFSRHMFFQPHLILYINRPEWVNAFRSPHYAVVLGRSQDLFMYTQIEVIELQQENQAYFEHTLMPYTANRRTNNGYAITMPRYLDYQNNRRPTFAQYFVMEHRIYSSEFLWFGEKLNEKYWIDPYSPVFNGAHLGLLFHSFIDEENTS